jgi:hypothetical protein
MLKNIFESKKVTAVLVVLISLAVLLVVFRFGMVVGERKANFSGRWSENYGRFFGEPRPGFFPAPAEFGDNRFMNPHGNAGTILKIDGNTLIVKGSDNNEKTILFSTSTLIKDKDETISGDSLKVGDSLVVIGEPTPEGQIEAKFIRVFSVK